MEQSLPEYLGQVAHSSNCNNRRRRTEIRDHTKASTYVVSSSSQDELHHKMRRFHTRRVHQSIASAALFYICKHCLSLFFWLWLPLSLSLPLSGSVVSIKS